MKARIGGQTTLDGLSGPMREVVEKAAAFRADQIVRNLQSQTARMHICLITLALHDLYGFGSVRSGRVIDAMNEISAGYIEQAYTPGELRGRPENLKRALELMEDEIHRRKLFTPRKRRTENGDKNTRTR